jgi:hypothetical protein
MPPARRRLTIPTGCAGSFRALWCWSHKWRYPGIPPPCAVRLGTIRGARNVAHSWGRARNSPLDRSHYGFSEVQVIQAWEAGERQVGRAMMRRTQGWIGLAGLVPGLMFAGCASLSAQYATRPPQGRTATEISRDEEACEQYAKRRPKLLSYRGCMVARSYAANMDMDKLGWTIGVAQTEPHTPGDVIRDMVECDEQATAAKTSETVRPLTTEEENIIAAQAPSAAPGLRSQQRQDEARMLVACLGERGYKVMPRVVRNPR